MLVVLAKVLKWTAAARCYKVQGHQDMRTTWSLEIFSSFHTFIDFLIEALPEGPGQARAGPTGVEQF